MQKGEKYMTITDLNKYIDTIKDDFELEITLDENTILSFKPIDFATSVAIANKIAETVVTEYGDYRPEYEKPLLLFHLLEKSAGIEMDDFDVEAMNILWNMKVGAHFNARMFEVSWVNSLFILIDQKIEYRKRMYCDPNVLLNSKLSELVMKQLEVEGKTETFMDTLSELSKSFNPDEIREYTKMASELNKAIQNPEVSDKFFKRIQSEAQNKRIKEADEIIEKAKKIIQMDEAKNVLAGK